MVGLGETCRRLFPNCMLRVTGPKDTNMCQYDQLCFGLKAVIYGTMHVVQSICDANASTEDLGFLLLDVKNVFNEINRIGMLWMVCHLCPSEARFVLNCYRHWSFIVLWNGNGTVRFMHGREGVMQGDPLSMVAYSIGVILLIKCLKVA